jgi:hypothetical protein
MSWKCRWGAVELPVCPTRPIRSPTRTSWPVASDTVPGARCAKTAKASAPCTITWFPATGANPLRAGSNPTVVLSASATSRTSWTRARSATPSTAATTRPSQAAWTGCPHP